MKGQVPGVPAACIACKAQEPDIITKTLEKSPLVLAQISTEHLLKHQTEKMFAWHDVRGFKRLAYENSHVPSEVPARHLAPLHL